MAVLSGMERSVSLLTGFRRVGPFRADGPARKSGSIKRDEVVSALKVLGYQHHAEAIAKESSIETLTGLVRDTSYDYIVSALAVRNIEERNQQDGIFTKLIELLEQSLVGRREAKRESLSRSIPFFTGGAAPITPEMLAARAGRYYPRGGAAPSPPPIPRMRPAVMIVDPIDPVHRVAVPREIAGLLESIDWDS